MKFIPTNLVAQVDLIIVFVLDQKKLLKSSKLDDLDVEELDLHTERLCGIPCPGDCVVSITLYLK